MYYNIYYILSTTLVVTFGSQVRCQLVSKFSLVTSSLDAGWREVPRVGVCFTFIRHLPVIDVIGICVDEHPDDSKRGRVEALNRTQDKSSHRKIANTHVPHFHTKTAYSICSEVST